MKGFLDRLLAAYGRYLSPLLGGGKCRYYPTCSAYAREAVRVHGPVRGVWLGVRRVLACHPYSRRPFHDPVPEAIKRGQQKNCVTKEAE